MNRHIFRRAAAIVLILTMVFSTGAVYGTDSAAAKALNNPEIPEISARSGVVIDGDTGKILYSKCRNIKRDPYSITKLLTVLVALEHLDPNQKITVNKTAANTEGSTAYLIAGEKVRTKDLVYAALLPSGNDAAVALAYGVSGSKAKFATLMNKKAKKLGCQNSHFANPHGWKSEKHYTTAYDMALITKAAMENDLIRKVLPAQKCIRCRRPTSTLRDGLQRQTISLPARNIRSAGFLQEKREPGITRTPRWFLHADVTAKCFTPL